MGDYREYAVYIRNLCKRYNEGPPILQNLSMNVRKGTIYGLLGSSGCGKTTVLSCIVGVKEWDSGELLVFGKKPGSKESGIPGRKLGYMPQDLALYDYLSIEEVIRFYGRLYSMSKVEIAERWAFLSKLLELPTNFKQIKDLSGGQQRRASLALALIHNPKLLILDEPTVGLDPLLRQSIWKHLYNLVSTLGTTIIITTHYIEEARLSNTIGVMRQGHLLVEDSPLNLLYHYNCQLLEEVVVQLCRKDEAQLKILGKAPDTSAVSNQVIFNSRDNNNCAVNVAVSKKEQERMQGIFRNAKSFDCENDYVMRADVENVLECQNGMSTEIYNFCRRIYGFTSVMIITFLRFPAFLVLLLFVPAIQGSITLLTIGSNVRDMHIGIVNYELDNNTMGCKFEDMASDSCDLTALSCKYLKRLSSSGTYILDFYNTEEEAFDSVKLGKTWGYLIFPQNYSKYSLELVVNKHFATNETLEGSRIHVHLDNSEAIRNFFMGKPVYESFLDYLRDLARNCQVDAQQATLPLKYRPPVYGTYEDDYTSFILPGIIICSLNLVITGLTGLTFVADYKKGTLSRARVAGLTTAELMLSHLLTQAVVTAGQILIWSAVLHFVFHVVIQGSVILFFVFCMLVGIFSASFGLFLGVLCRDEVRGLVVEVFLTPLLLLYGGAVFPIEIMSPFGRAFGMLLPTHMPTLSLRSVIVRGLGWSHAQVWPGIGVLILWTLVISIISIFGLRKLCK